jgi:amino acid adenylation domain-containing protein
MPPVVNSGFHLSAQQRQAWLSHHGHPAAAQCVAELEGPVDARRLETALRATIDRHEILRTTFSRPPGMTVPLQVVNLTAPVSLREVDLVRSAGRGGSTALSGLAREEARATIDLAAGPVVRAVYVRGEGERQALIITLPGLCADARTLDQIVREVAACYAASGTGLATEPLQYADYAQWQRELAEAGDEDAKAGEVHWNGARAGAAASSRSPLADGQPADGRFEPERYVVELPPEVVTEIDAAARAQGVSAASLPLACWHALLARLTGEDETASGYVLDGRTHEDLQEAAGLYVRTVPLCCAPASHSLAEAAKLVDSEVKLATRWQDYAAAEEGASAAGWRMTPFEYDESQFRANGAGLRFTVRSKVCHPHPYHLKLTFHRSGGGGSLEFSYDPRAVERESVERIAGCYRRLLETALRQPTVPLQEIDLLDPSDRERLIFEPNRTESKQSGESCFHFEFERQAELTPDRTALVAGGRSWSYAELNAEANRLAHWLRSKGVGRGACVGLLIERRGEAIVGLLGILKAGGAYVPLGVTAPRARLAHQLAETGTHCVVTLAGLEDRLPESAAHVIRLDADLEQLAACSSENPPHDAGPDDPVYVIYTSGSTGTPKGVVVRHRNLLNYSRFINSTLGAFGKNGGDPWNFATVSTLGADLGNTCIFPPLISGHCVHVVDYDTAMDAGSFGKYVAQHGIDVIKMTPSHLSTLLALDPAGACLPRRYLFLGGEALTWPLVDRIRSAGTCDIFNHYGPTETTVGSLLYAVPKAPAVRSGSVPLGRPMANTQVYVLDGFRRPVPIGFPGELYIGGAGVALGYVGQPQQTAERFVANPFVKEGGLVYRTGDRVRYLPDGNLEFLGRVDDQVKVRGYRVEPAEIEAILGALPQVNRAAVITRRSGEENRLVAYVARSAGARLTAEELRRSLAEKVPDYMVPAAIVLVDELPLNANGKVDRKALLALEETTAAPVEHLAPRNAVEETLVGIWKEVLKIDRFGVDDDFFALGGHSLVATQVVALIRSAFGVPFPLRTVFESPTIAGLAEAVGSLLESHSAGDEVSALLAEMEGMSDEEAQRLLEIEGGEG